MFYGGESNVPGAPGNLLARNLFSSSFVIPQAMGTPDMMQMGNMSSMGNIGNAGFFMGPQMGQGIPPGYMNKIVS
jgi:hypothetical protein